MKEDVKKGKIISMIDKIRDFLLPGEGNNHQASGLSLSSLSFYVTLVVIFQIGVNILGFVNPNILGYATNVSIDDIYRFTNQKRMENGLSTLTLNPQLSDAARRKAEDMFNNGYWAHISPNGATPWDFIVGSGYYYVYAGENLAKDFMDSNGVVDAWMNSPSHRDNLLNGKYQDIGLAVVNGELDGMETTLVVQMFGTAQGQSKQVAVVEGVDQVEEVVVEVEPTVTPVAVVAGSDNEEGGGSEMVVGEAVRVDEPAVSVFGLTKNFSVVVIVFLLILVAIDMVIISQKRVRRLSGSSFFHFSFLIFILAAVLLTSAGTIL